MHEYPYGILIKIIFFSLKGVVLKQQDDEIIYIYIYINC